MTSYRLVYPGRHSILPVSFFLKGSITAWHVVAVSLAGTTWNARGIINTIGPVWDGNRIWMITAAGRVCVVPAGLCHPVQRILPGANSHAGGADPPRRGFRVPWQTGR